MARPTSIRDFQAAQRGELEAGSDGLATVIAAQTGVDPRDDQVADVDSIEPKADDRAAPLTYDVDTDGLVADVRPAEMSPDRGPDVGTTHHQVHDWRDAVRDRAATPSDDDAVDDDAQRFSGAGTADDEDVQQASLFLVPGDAAFNGAQFRAAPELADIAERLIDEHGFLRELINCQISYLWKRKTGVSKGKLKIGFLARGSGLLGHYSKADFLVWLSASTARDARFTDRQVEAAIFHQLCVPAGTEVTSTKVEAASARWYAGHLVEIGTASGHFLACTPNHPVLTGRGWVPAGLLKEGDHVVSSGRPERVSAAMDPDEHQPPAAIEQVARSLGMALPLVPPATHDLDPDWLGGEVQVVTADGKLRRGFQTARLEHGQHLAFSRRDARGVLLASEGELFERGLRVSLARPRFTGSRLGNLQGSTLVRSGEAKALALGSIADLDAGALQKALDHRDGYFVCVGQSGHRLARAVAFDDGITVERGSLPRRATGTGRLGRPSEDDAGLTKPLADRWGADSADFGERLQRIPGGVALDQIVSLQRRPFSGHVYNLRTSQSWYSANGIIVHNCHVGEDDNGNWIKVGHDFEGFATEVRHYGTWTEDLKVGGDAFKIARQLGLDLDGADDEDDEESEDEDDDTNDEEGELPGDPAGEIIEQIDADEGEGPAAP